MKIEDIEVGMNVRRTCSSSGAPEGYTFTVMSVAGTSAVCDRGRMHSVWNLEPSDLEQRLSLAQAAVDRIKAEIQDRDRPKVGDIITWGSGGIKYEVCAVDDDWRALKSVTSGPWDRIWRKHDSLNNFKIVSRASA